MVRQKKRGVIGDELTDGEEGEPSTAPTLFVDWKWLYHTQSDRKSVSRRVKKRRRRRGKKKKKFNCKYPVIISYVIRSVESKPDTWSRGVFVCWMAHNSRGGNVVSGRRTLPVTLVVCVPRPLWAIDGQLSWPTLFYVSFLAAHLVGKPHCCAIFVLHSGMVAA